MEFTLKRDVTGATPINRAGKLQNQDVKTLLAGTTVFIHTSAYDCPDSNPPQQCVKLIQNGEMYEVSKRVFDVAMA